MTEKSKNPNKHNETTTIEEDIRKPKQWQENSTPNFEDFHYGKPTPKVKRRRTFIATAVNPDDVDLAELNKAIEASIDLFNSTEPVEVHHTMWWNRMGCPKQYVKNTKKIKPISLDAVTVALRKLGFEIPENKKR